MHKQKARTDDTMCMTPLRNVLARALQDLKNLANRNAARKTKQELLDDIHASIGAMTSKCIVMQGPMLQTGGTNTLLNFIVYNLSSQLPESPNRTPEEQMQIEAELKEVVDLKEQIMTLLLSDKLETDESKLDKDVDGVALDTRMHIGSPDIKSDVLTMDKDVDGVAQDTRMYIGSPDVKRAVFKLVARYVRAAREYAKSPLPGSNLVVTLHKEGCYAFRGMEDAIIDVVVAMKDLIPVDSIMLDCPKHKPGRVKHAAAKGASRSAKRICRGKSTDEVEAKKKRARLVKMLVGGVVKLRPMKDGSTQGQVPLSHKAVDMEVAGLPAVQAGLHTIEAGRALTAEELADTAWTSTEWEEYKTSVEMHRLQSIEFKARGYEFLWNLIMPEHLMREFDDATLNEIRTGGANFAYMRLAKSAPTTGEMQVPTATTVLSYFSYSTAQAPQMPQGAMPWKDHHEVGATHMSPNIHDINFQVLFLAKNNTLAYVDKWGLSTRAGETSKQNAYAALHDSKMSAVVLDTTADPADISHYVHIPVVLANNSFNTVQFTAFGALSCLVAPLHETTWSLMWCCHDQHNMVNNASPAVDLVENQNVGVLWVSQPESSSVAPQNKLVLSKKAPSLYFVNGLLELDHAKLAAFKDFQDIKQDPEPLTDEEIKEMLLRNHVKVVWSATGDPLKLSSVLMFGGAKFFDLRSTDLDFEVRHHDTNDDEEGELLPPSRVYIIKDNGKNVRVLEYHVQEDLLIKATVTHQSTTAREFSYSYSEGEAIPYSLCTYPADWDSDFDGVWKPQMVDADCVLDVGAFPHRMSAGEARAEAILIREADDLRYILLYKLAAPDQLAAPVQLAAPARPADVTNIQEGLDAMEVDDLAHLDDSPELTAEFLLKVLTAT